METIKYPVKESWESLLQRPVADQADIEATVKKIIGEVKEKGDQALKDYNLKFDKVSVDNLKAEEEELTEAKNQLSMELIEAMQLAKRNIELFHKSQLQEEEPVETMPGVTCWRESMMCINTSLAEHRTSILMLIRLHVLFGKHCLHRLTQDTVIPKTST